MSTTSVTWRLAGYIIWSHARLCWQTTTRIALLVGVMLWLGGLYWQTPLLSWLWLQHPRACMMGLLLLHFGPVNLYVVRRLFNQPTLLAPYRLQALSESCRQH